MFANTTLHEGAIGAMFQGRTLVPLATNNQKFSKQRLEIELFRGDPALAATPEGIVCIAGMLQ